MKLSIIICTKNRLNSLSLVLKELLLTNIKDYELIVVDGNSEDRTKEFLIELYTKGIIKYANNLGNHIEARNTGLKIATGEYVTFIDDDDMFGKNKFDVQVKFLDENPDIDVISSTTLLGKNVGLQHTFDKLTHDDITKLLKKKENNIEHICNFHSCMFRKSSLDKLFKNNNKPGYFYNEFNTGFEGSGLLYTLYFSGCKFYNTNETFYLYNISSENTSLSKLMTPDFYNENYLGKTLATKKKNIIKLYNSYKDFVEESVVDEQSVEETPKKKTRKTKKNNQDEK